MLYVYHIGTGGRRVCKMIVCNCMDRTASTDLPSMTLDEGLRRTMSSRSRIRLSRVITMRPIPLLIGYLSELAVRMSSPVFGCACDDIGIVTDGSLGGHRTEPSDRPPYFDIHYL